MFSAVRTLRGRPLPTLLSILPVSWIFFINLLLKLRFHFLPGNSLIIFRAPHPCQLVPKLKLYRHLQNVY